MWCHARGHNKGLLLTWWEEQNQRVTVHKPNGSLYLAANIFWGYCIVWRIDCVGSAEGMQWLAVVP